MIKKIMIVLSAAIGIFLAYVAMQSNHYEIAREITVQASAEKIFPYINNSHKTFEWMPWKEMDSKMSMRFEGPDEGVGSRSIWESEGKMGHGSAEVVESVANAFVKTRLEYTKPMSMSQIAQISLAPEDGVTRVVWMVSGENTFISRLFCFFMDMDKVVGTQFEKGLATLKSQVEASPNP